MIGNKIEFKENDYGGRKNGVILDKYIDAYTYGGADRTSRDIFTFCLVDFYLIRLDDGSLTSIQPSRITRIISFYNELK